MIEGGITWGQLAAVLTGGVAVITPLAGGLIYLFRTFKELRKEISTDNEKQDKAVKTDIDKLHERQSRLRSDLQGFRTEVAQSYVNNSHLTDVESRLTKSLDGLTEEVRKLMDILINRAG